MFSIIIPLYNKGFSISETIQSVLNQTFKDFELVIVNDGSTDNSPEIVQQIEDERIRLIHQKNQGVSAARNNGIRNAKYEWIAFLDADDKWSDNFLEEIYKAIKHFPNEKIFSGGQRSIYKNKSERYTNPFLPDEGEISLINYYEIISDYNPPIHSSNVVIKKGVFDLYGYFIVGQRNYEDHNLWERLCVNSKVVYVNKEISYFIRLDENSASKNPISAKDFTTMIKTFREVVIQLNESDKQYYKKYYNRSIALTLIKNRKYYTKDDLNVIKKEYRKLCEFPYIQLYDAIILLNIKSLKKILRPFRHLFLKSTVK